jgi:hypothetical protein
MVAREGRAPVLENTDEASVGKMGLDLLLRQVGKAKSGERRQVNERSRVEHELAFDPHPQLSAVLLELPGVEPTMCRRSKVDAGMSGELLRDPGFERCSR